MNQPAERSPWLATVLLIPVLALLIGLGFWQVDRLRWKEGLLHEIAVAQTSPPKPVLAALAQQAAGRSVDYARVVASCPDIERTAYLRVFNINEGEPGYRLVTACTLNGGSYRTVLVDRGYVAKDDIGKVHPEQGRRIDTPIVGVLREAGKAGWLTPPDQPAINLWRRRNIPAMAAALHASRPAPLFLMLEKPSPSGFGPTPVPVPVDIPNNHLGYAATWFGLAMVLSIMHGSTLWRRWRSRRQAQGAAGADSR